MFVHENLHRHVFFQEVCIFPKLALLERQLLEGLRVHKGIGLVGRIEELHGPFFEIWLFEPFSGSEGTIQDIA